MITKFRLFENFFENEEGDIVVVAVNDASARGLIKGHKYIVTNFDKYGRISRVIDISNHIPYFNVCSSDFVSEIEYETKKYNI
jgi:hypothetical protein